MESLRFGVIVYIAKSATSCNNCKAIVKINTFEIRVRKMSRFEALNFGRHDTNSERFKVH